MCSYFREELSVMMLVQEEFAVWPPDSSRIKSRQHSQRVLLQAPFPATSSTVPLPLLCRNDDIVELYSQNLEILQCLMS
jgi:hypothetical protein